MIKKLIRQMLPAQIFSALTVSLCLLIDSIITGRFLGTKALAAYQLANPILLVIGAIGSMLAAGIQVACSRSLGRGSQEETNAGYSSSIVLTFGISFTLLLLVLLFRGPLATVMGAGTEGELYDQTKSYLAGFIIGAPASMGALILVPFMQMAGQSGLLVCAVLGMTVTDIGLDLLNVLVFHGGMFGMGLASSLSYYVALIIGAFYFLSKKCVFRFSLRLVTGRKISELFRSGIPTVFNMASSVVFIFLMNKILLSIRGDEAVTAFSVINTIGNSSNCITTGVGGVSLTLAGIFFNEEDRSGLKEQLRLLCTHSVILGLAVGILLLLFSPLLARLFITEPGPSMDMAVLGVRIYAAGLIPCCITGILKNYYQATGRVLLTEGISIIECALFPTLAAFILGRVWGTTGIWLYFVAAELLTLASISLYVYLKTKSSPLKSNAVLLLDRSFGVPAERLLETDIHRIDEVTSVAEQAEQFCLTHGQSPRISNHIALCVEEMAGNTILHGFVKDNKPHHLSVRLLEKEDHLILRFRDDCRAFDPVHYVPNEGKDALGIRLVRAIAEDAQYTYSLSMNNLMLRLPADRTDSEAQEEKG
ncbi:MAG: ATP-binding protein [Clostridia bacterium]|nr:ATP-binding protein [Clostridia bacterium]